MAWKGHLRLVCLASAGFVVFFSGTARSYDDEITHPELTERSSKESGLDAYLRDRLDLAGGRKTKFKLGTTEHELWKWMSDGSFDEDQPMCRAVSHFHNPLKPWGLSGMSDEPWFIDAYCSAWKAWSNVTWATAYLSKAPLGTQTSTNNEFDYDSLRLCYVAALTKPSAQDRDRFFVKTFQALGHVLHMIQDMAVPAHTRNDFRAHLYFQSPSWDWPTEWYGNNYESHVKDLGVDLPADVVRPEEISETSITRFWDTDVYNGGNRSRSMTRGLAEYTNANYMSEFTIFTENDDEDVHRFPHPAKADTDAEGMEVMAEDGEIDKVWHAIFQDNHSPVAAYSYFWIHTKGLGGLVPHAGWEYYLDDEVFKTYAANLIPRAVGYGAAIVDHFFHGHLRLESESGQSNQYVILNETPDELNGSFSLYYDDAQGERRQVDGAAWEMAVHAKAGEVPGRSERTVTFQEPANPPPGEKGRYILVFDGTIKREGTLWWDKHVIGNVVRLPSCAFCETWENAQVVADLHDTYFWFHGKKIKGDQEWFVGYSDDPDMYYSASYGVAQVPGVPTGNIMSFHVLQSNPSWWHGSPMFTAFQTLAPKASYCWWLDPGEDTGMNVRIEQGMRFKETIKLLKAEGIAGPYSGVGYDIRVYYGSNKYGDTQWGIYSHSEDFWRASGAVAEIDLDLYGEVSEHTWWVNWWNDQMGTGKHWDPEDFTAYCIWALFDFVGSRPNTWVSGSVYIGDVEIQAPQGEGQ